MKFVLIFSILFVASSVQSAPNSNVEHQSSSVQIVPGVQASAPIVPPEVAHAQPAAVEPSVVVPQVQPVAVPSLVSVPSHYAPAGIVQVMNSPPSSSFVSSSKPVHASVSPLSKNEQYGQPESAAVPSNYKPWGSWGLYIGGNPADGYYTNYYKSISSSVEKAGGVEKPVSSVVGPSLRQFGGSVVPGSPYQGADYYPFTYSTQDFASNAQIVPQVFGGSLEVPSPSSHVSGAPSSYIPEMYGSKTRASGTKQQQQQQQYQQQEQAPTKSASKLATKSSQSALGYYATPVSGAVNLHHQQPQIVAYPVPVGSQIVGSQVGVDGAFYPYGVHAFTKYALKPTVVAASPVEHQVTPAHPHQPQVYPQSSQVYQQGSGQVYQQSPVYHNSVGAYNPSQFSGVQQVSPYKYTPVQVVPSSYSNYGYVAYPASQLHYSNGLVVPGSVHSSQSSASSSAVSSPSAHVIDNYPSYVSSQVVPSVPSVLSSFEDEEVKPVKSS